MPDAGFPAPSWPVSPVTPRFALSPTPPASAAAAVRPHLSLHEWACIRTELIWIYQHPPLNRGKAVEYDHTHGNWAWFFVQGHGWTESTSGTLKARKGQWLFPSRERVRQYFSPDASIISVHFHCHWPSGQDVLASAEGLVLASEREPELLRTAEALEALVRRHFPGDDESHKYQAAQFSDFDLFLGFQSLFLSWLAVWFRTRVDAGARLTRLQAGDDRTLRAVRGLNEAPLEASYPRDRLRRETGLSDVHLNRIFLRAYGLTPRKYWERRQLEFARQCLETSTIPVKEIAYRTGFRSVSHFVVWFRRLTEKTPSDFRNQGQTEGRE